MRHIRDRKYGYRAAVILAASAIAGTTPMTAFATLASRPDENYEVAEPRRRISARISARNLLIPQINGRPSGTM